MRKLGDAFHPDMVDEYTGLALYMHPIRSHVIPGVWEIPWAMGFWRADGMLKAVCQVTPEEYAWLFHNPAQYAAEHAQFEVWRVSVQQPRKHV